MEDRVLSCQQTIFFGKVILGYLWLCASKINSQQDPVSSCNENSLISLKHVSPTSSHHPIAVGLI